MPQDAGATARSLDGAVGRRRRAGRGAARWPAPVRPGSHRGPRRVHLDQAAHPGPAGRAKALAVRAAGDRDRGRPRTGGGHRLVRRSRVIRCRFGRKAWCQVHCTVNVPLRTERSQVMPNPTQIMRNGSRLLATRATLLNGQANGFRTPLRAEIEASWRRSMAHGVRPDRLNVPHAGTADCADELRRAASPVADAVGTDLSGMGVSLLVSDHEGCIIDRRVPDADLRARLDRIDLAPGFRYGEEAVGTTAISVALSSRGPALVAAGEHFAD